MFKRISTESSSVVPMSRRRRDQDPLNYEKEFKALARDHLKNYFDDLGALSTLRSMSK
jgi:hypothetical protein